MGALFGSGFQVNLSQIVMLFGWGLGRRVWVFLSVPDDDTLVLTVDEHVPVHVVGESIDVWGILVLGLPGEVTSQPRARSQGSWGLCLPPSLGLTAPW